MRNWIVHFLGTRIPSKGEIETMEAALKLFFDDRHLSMDTFTLKKCLTYCDHLGSLEVMFRNSRKHYPSASARIGLGAETFTSYRSAAVYMTKIGLAIPELAVFQFPEPVNGSALHHVAEGLTATASDDCMEGWIQFGADIIQNGADLFSIKTSPHGTTETPLLVVLLDSTFSELRWPLQRWNDMLRRANVDLEWYCAKESEMWETLGTGLYDWRDRSTTCATRLVELKFCRETQSCIPVVGDVVTIPVMRLRLIPGSFVGSQYPVETICWESLSKEEEEEGHWSRIGEVVIHGSLTYDCDPKQESRCWYSKLIDCTQDDNGTLLRMTRSSRNGNSSNKRASSQPPSQRIARDDGQILFSSSLHAWLPPYHYCHVQSTWTVSCHHGPLERRLDPSVSNEARLCVYQKDSADVGHHEWLWGGTNFLHEIADCQSSRRRYGDPQHPTLRHSHKIGCPQGCDQVDLEKLTKPQFLPRWHPCRNEL